MSNKLYYERKAQGICVQCGRNPAAPTHVYCEECLEKNRIANHDRWRTTPITPHRREYNARWQKEKRDKRREAGLCIRCGQPRTGKSKCFCEDCFEKYKATRARWEARILMEKMGNSV